MAEKKIRTELFMVKAPFFYKNDQFFAAGQVVVAGHPVLKGRQHLFRPLAPIGMPAPPNTEPEISADTEPAAEPEPAS